MSNKKTPEFNAKNKLWSGRFTKANDTFVEQFSASIQVDKKLAKYDIKGSIAHANMLNAVGVLTENEKNNIVDGLNEIFKQIESNQFIWRQDLEDVHMNIENALIENIGEIGKKLHTARSRNDQVTTDLRLYLREENNNLRTLLVGFAQSLYQLACKNLNVIMPGFTHLQAAQPIIFSHHLLAWFEMIARDLERLAEIHKRINTLPLGSAALAGSPYPINRKMVADELGFERICENSLDAVSDRDFCIDFLNSGSLLMMHYSRMCEEMIIWSSAQFNFIDFDDSFCTGSSIMPQKKNPDIAELVRGKTSRLYGSLISLLTLMKSQPLAYNRDNQEDKEPIFDAVETLKNCTIAMNGLITHLNVNQKSMKKSTDLGFTNATDLADYLVSKRIAFRDAHKIVGQCVKLAIAKNCFLQDLTLEEMKTIHPIIESDVYGELDLMTSINKRSHHGGTAPKRIKIALESVKKRIDFFQSHID